MIVSHEKKFIYVAIPKTGSRSIQENLRSFASSFAVGNSPNNHIKIDRILELEKFREDLTFKLDGSTFPYFIVANMRNPWDRLVSLFEYVYKYREFYAGVPLDPTLPYNETRQSQYLNLLVNNTSGTKDLIKLIYNRDKDYQKHWLDKHNIEGNLRYLLQSYIEEQNKKYSFMDLYLKFHKYKESINIIKFENLQEDFDKVCTKLDLPHIKLLHENKTKHKHYTEYYDEETKEIVAERFANDIEYLGYEFGE